MKTPVKRIVIYPKDVQIITGRSYRQSTRLLQKIREDLNKPIKNFISIEEFCQYTGLKLEQVEQHIIG